VRPNEAALPLCPSALIFHHRRVKFIEDCTGMLGPQSRDANQKGSWKTYCSRVVPASACIRLLQTGQLAIFLLGCRSQLRELAHYAFAFLLAAIGKHEEHAQRLANNSALFVT
jgi:hypothetical protein